MDTTTVIVGAGRIGGALAALGPCTLVRRGEPIPDDGRGPIIVCTRNDALDTIVAAVPARRHGDLVFVQNGMILDWLESRKLAGTTQALLYFAVPTVGATPQDGGRTVVTGPWADALSERLARGGLACRSVDRAQYRIALVEKLLWTCVFGVLCERHRATVGSVAVERRGELDDLTAELARVCESALGSSLPRGVSERLVAYSLTIPDYRAAVKELRWRNGWVLGRQRTPLHVAWLRELGHIA